MASEPKSEFNYKPAFILALLGNVVLLGAWMSFILKTPVEAIPRLQTPPGSPIRQLYMDYGDTVAVSCQNRNGKPGRLLRFDRTPLILSCSDVQNFSPSNR